MYVHLLDTSADFSSNADTPIKRDTASMIRDLAYRSERAHIFYCYKMLLQIASTSKPATAWLPNGHSEVEQVDTPQFSHFNSKELATSCLQLLGDEMGFPA